MYVQSVLYILAGFNHFRNPLMYQSIVPPSLPAADAVLYSGVAEVVLGVLLLVPAWRRSAGWGVIALLIAVFPANIYMMVQYLADNRAYGWLTIVRLPIQAILIWLAWWSTKAGNRGQAAASAQ